MSDLWQRLHTCRRGHLSFAFHTLYHAAVLHCFIRFCCIQVVVITGQVRSDSLIITYGRNFKEKLRIPTLNFYGKIRKMTPPRKSYKLLIWFTHLAAHTNNAVGFRRREHLSLNCMSHTWSGSRLTVFFKTIFNGFYMRCVFVMHSEQVAGLHLCICSNVKISGIISVSHWGRSGVGLLLT